MKIGPNLKEALEVIAVAMVFVMFCYFLLHN